MPRIELVQDTPFYVDPAGSNANNGSASSRWRDWQHAYEWIKANVDHRGFKAYVNGTSGATYNSGITADGCDSGQTIYNGNGCFIDSAADCLRVTGGASLVVSGMMLRSANACNVYTSSHSRFKALTGMEYAGAKIVDVWVNQQGLAILANDYVQSGKSDGHWLSNSNSGIECSGVKVTLKNAPIRARYAVADMDATITSGSVQWIGAMALGCMEHISANGSHIQTWGNGFPGDIPGSHVTGTYN